MCMNMIILCMSIRTYIAFICPLYLCSALLETVSVELRYINKIYYYYMMMMVRMMMMMKMMMMMMMIMMIYYLKMFSNFLRLQQLSLLTKVCHRMFPGQTAISFVIDSHLSCHVCTCTL